MPHSPQIKQRQAINSNYIPGMYIPCWPMAATSRETFPLIN